MSCFGGQMNEYRKISIDRFDGKNLKSTVYFLSHCHEDHTQGLEKSAFFDRLRSRTDVFLYCSQVTKLLLSENEKYRHLVKYVKTVEVEVPTTIVIPDTGSNKVENITVTLLHAAHCPGSVMFLIEGSEGTVLYTGDFRWESNHVSRVEALHSGDSVKQIESLYIDTTFCHPSSLYIPYRQDCADAVFSLVREWIAKGGNYMVHFTPRSTYGHEHLLKDVSERTGFKVHVSPWKFNIYRQIPELRDVFTEYGDETPIHACYGEKYKKDRTRLPCGYKPENHDKLNVMVILPSTMYFTKKVALNLKDIVEKKGGLYRVCYSFHSSMIEVRDLVTYLQPRRVRPNVKPMDDKGMADVQKRLNDFLQLKNKHRINEEEEDVVKPLGILKKSVFPRKRRHSVQSNDSLELVFNSPDEKRPKFSAKSPYKVTDGGDGGGDSDTDDDHSSYAGSIANSESELSGLCELEEEDRLSTPPQSLLDALDSQESQELSGGGKSNSLSYRVCKDEDVEQTVDNAPEEIITEEATEDSEIDDADSKLDVCENVQKYNTKTDDEVCKDLSAVDDEKEKEGDNDKNVGSFDLFESLGSLDSERSSENCDITKQHCDVTKQHCDASRQNKNLAEKCDKEIQNNKLNIEIDTKETKAQQNKDIDDDKSTKSSQGFSISGINDITGSPLKSSQGFSVSSEKHEEDLVEKIDVDFDSDNDVMIDKQVPKLQTPQKNKHLPSFKRNCIYVENSIDDIQANGNGDCNEIHDCDESDSDETLPPSPNFTIGYINSFSKKTEKSFKGNNTKDDILYISDDSNQAYIYDHGDSLFNDVKGNARIVGKKPEYVIDLTQSDSEPDE